MKSIFLKIFLWFWLTVVLVALGFAFLWSLENDTGPSPQSLTGRAVSMYAAAAAQNFEAGGAPAVANFLAQLRSQTQLRAALLNSELQPIAGDLSNVDPAFLRKAAYARQAQFETRNDSLYVAASARSAQGREYLFAVQLPRRPGGLFHGSFGDVIFRWFVAILISGLVCYTLTRYLVQPVLRLRGAARDISAGDFSARVPRRLADRRDEFGELVRDFNQMADQIQRLMNTQQQLLRDISHELRSPLTRLNVALELARSSSGSEASYALDRIEQESERLNEMIGRLLTLARIQTLVDPPQLSVIALRPLIDQIAQDARFEAAAKNCYVEVTGDQDCSLKGSEELLYSAIENVVRNAVRHTLEKTKVHIDLRCDGRNTHISVADEGPGVPEQELSKIFHPFYRLSDAREHRSGGTGIGLAITNEVARLHGGTVTARNAQPYGLIVQLNLPCASESLVKEN